MIDDQDPVKKQQQAIMDAISQGDREQEAVWRALGWLMMLLVMALAVAHLMLAL